MPRTLILGEEGEGEREREGRERERGEGEREREGEGRERERGGREGERGRERGGREGERGRERGRERGEREREREGRERGEGEGEREGEREGEGREKYTIHCNSNVVSSAHCFAVGLLHHGMASFCFHSDSSIYSCSSESVRFPAYGRTSPSCILQRNISIGEISVR